MSFDELLRLVESGGTPVSLAIVYFLWKMDKALSEFIAEIRGQQDGRDGKLKDIHTDITAVIKKLAGLNGASNNEKSNHSL